LSDGSLSAKNREILCKKAEKKGIDRDEFEMILEYRMKQKGHAAPHTSQYGSVQKCPNCGASVKAYNAKCDECGYEFTDVKHTSCVEELVKQLKDASHPKGLRGLIFDDTNEEDVIRAFQVPPTKVDVIEFLTYAVPLAKKKRERIFSDDQLDVMHHNELAPIWHNKCEQVWNQAKVLFKDIPADLETIRNIVKEIGLK
jgi:hypothetical protein